MNGFPERGFFAFFPFAVNCHMEVLDGLALFVEDGHDIDAAAGAEAHEEHLHGADAEVGPAGFGAAVEAYGVAVGIFCFETKVAAYSIQLDSDHKFEIFAKLRGVSTYFASIFMNYLRLDQAFELEGGGVLPSITIAYHTYGRLNADGSNVVWVCHALTANSDVAR